MAQAATIDASFLQKASSPRGFGVEGLERAAIAMRRTARVVQTQWTELPVEQREFLSAWAYRIVDPPRTLGTFATALLGRSYRAYLMLRGAEQQYIEFGGALVRLVESILERAEEENPEYQSMIREAVSDIGSPDSWTQVRGPDDPHPAV